MQLYLDGCRTGNPLIDPPHPSVAKRPECLPEVGRRRYRRVRSGRGAFGLVDREKAFCPDPAAGDVFDSRGIDREQGGLVLVRPDQNVAQVLPLAAHRALADFSSGVLPDAR